LEREVEENSVSTSIETTVRASTSIRSGPFFLRRLERNTPQIRHRFQLSMLQEVDSPRFSEEEDFQISQSSSELDISVGLLREESRLSEVHVSLLPKTTLAGMGN